MTRILCLVGALSVQSVFASDTGTVRYQGGQTVSVRGKAVVESLSADTPNEVLNLRATGGTRLPLGGDDLTWAPFSGLGFRRLVNDLLSDRSGGYVREQVYWYLPLGVELADSRGLRWNWALSLEGDLLLAGENTSGADTFTQNKGFGAQASMDLVYRPARGLVQFVFTPFYRYWNIGQSSVSPGGYVEPENNTSEIGFRATVRY